MADRKSRVPAQEGVQVGGSDPGRLKAAQRGGRWPGTGILPDIAAVAILLVSTVHLVAHNGGRSPRDMTWVLVVCTAGTLALTPTLRRTSRGFAWLCSAWSLGFVVALAAAEVRAGAVRPLSAAALAPAVALATVRVWRRPWGPAALGAILALTAARSWYLTFLAWWGGWMGRPTWLALSWHNQSGTLMGALGVAATATAAVLRSRSDLEGGAKAAARAATLVAILLAGATLAAAWLSGSRGAVIATGIGIAAVLVGLWRNGELRRAGPALAAVVLASAVCLIGLESMVASDAGQPLTTRSQSAAGNLSARFGYWEAAAGMAVARPLTGWGPGSYRWASLPFYPDDVTLTASAHNEYLEVLAEGGLVGAVPVWLAALVIALLAGRAVFQRRTGTYSASRGAGVLAAAGAVIMLGVHAGVDFDWDYPLLIALLATGGGVLWAEGARPHGGSGEAMSHKTGWAPAAVAAAGLLLLLGIATAATVLTRRGETPWLLNRRLVAAVTAMDSGDIALAREELTTARAWNPGAPSLGIVAAVVEQRAGALSDSALVARVHPRTTSHSDQLLVARRLQASGNAAAARGVVDSLAPVLESRRVWGVHSRVVEVAALQLETEASLSGCAEAQARVRPVLRWVEGFRVSPEAVSELLISASRESHCDLVRTPNG